MIFSAQHKNEMHCCSELRNLHVGLLFLFSPRTACASHLRSKSYTMSHFVLCQWFRFPDAHYLHQNKARYIAFHSCVYLNNAPQTQLSTSFLPHTWALECGTSVPRGTVRGWVPVAGPYSGDMRWPCLLNFVFSKWQIQNRRKEQENSRNDNYLLTIKNGGNNGDRWPDLVEINLTIKN